MNAEQFFHTLGVFDRDWRDFLKQAGKTVPQSPEFPFPGIRALAFCHFLRRNPGCSLKIAAAAIGIAQGTASSIADTLCQRGIIFRKADANDRRKICLTLAPETNAFLAGQENFLAERESNHAFSKKNS